METNKPLILDIPEIDFKKQVLDNAQAGEVYLDEAKNKAKDILAEAEKEATEIIEDAHLKAREILVEAREEGYKEGLNKAQKEWENKEKELIQKFEVLQNAVNKRFEDICKSLQDEALNLALIIAEKIVKTEIDRNDKAFRAVVADALSKIRKEERITIRVSTEDYGKYSDSLSELGDKDCLITVVKDDKLAPGGCIIETPSGYIDAGIDTQLKKITEELKEV